MSKDTIHVFIKSLEFLRLAGCSRRATATQLHPTAGAFAPINAYRMWITPASRNDGSKPTKSALPALTTTHAREFFTAWLEAKKAEQLLIGDGGRIAGIKIGREVTTLEFDRNGGALKANMVELGQ